MTDEERMVGIQCRKMVESIIENGNGDAILVPRGHGERAIKIIEHLFSDHYGMQVDIRLVKHLDPEGRESVVVYQYEAKLETEDSIRAHLIRKAGFLI